MLKSVVSALNNEKKFVSVQRLLITIILIGLWHLSRLSNNIDVLNQHFCFSCRGAEVSDCGKYLILTPHEGCAPVNRLFYCDLENQDGIKGEISQLL